MLSVYIIAILELSRRNHDTLQTVAERSGDTQNRVRSIEFKADLKALEPRVLPTTALIKQRSLGRSRQPWTMQAHDIVSLTQSIGDWIERAESALLIIDAMRGREIASELVGGILQPKVHLICWHLSEQDESVEVAEILRSLVWQMYEADPVRLASCLGDNWNQNDKTQLVKLLIRATAQLRVCYIVVDTDGILRSGSGEDGLDDLVTALQGVVEQALEEAQVKVLLIGSQIASRTSKMSTVRTKTSRRVISLRPPAPVPASRQRPGTGNFFHNPRWRNLQSRLPTAP